LQSTSIEKEEEEFVVEVKAAAQQQWEINNKTTQINAKEEKAETKQRSELSNRISNR